ncbi:MAG: hypothetical protein M0R40_05815 [Firmicutes bacterium]|nr:hypothetical protein [Bacillota bacterium]
MKNETTTNEWALYQRGVNYKNQIGLYQTVQDNNKFFQGEQWQGVENEGLPTPVFNIIKPVVRYKVSTVMQNDVKVIYSCGNSDAPNYQQLEEFAEILTKHSAIMWEKLKMDFLNENVLKDAAIQGDGICHFFWDDGIKAELIDNTNLYVANQNYADIQSQEYIVISYRENVSKVRKEAEKFGVKDVELITSDTNVSEQAGQWVELQDEGMCIVLLKYWKENGTVRFRKSTKNVVLIENEDTLLSKYPIAFFNWESVKNSFHGVSDVTGLIPNQKYINTIAALIQFSTMHTAFPKMVYNSALIDNPDNAIGVAIGISGAENVKNMIDYIMPPPISADAFKMFDTTIALTKDLMGANDSALGNIDPEKASGKSILALIDQSTVPLESIRRRFFNYIEDVAIIWADMWRVHAQEGLSVHFNSNGVLHTANIPAEAFESMMIETKIDVGASTRWTEVALIKTLDNLLMNKYIPFDWYVELMPEGSGLPKAKLKELLKSEQKDDLDIDEMIDNMPEHVRQEALHNPQILEDIIMQHVGE